MLEGVLLGDNLDLLLPQSLVLLVLGCQLLLVVVMADLVLL
jgi:hypothetical protein